MWLLRRLAGSCASTTARGGQVSFSKFVPVRAYAEDAASTEKLKKPPAITEDLRKAWKAVAPMLDVPKVPSDFLEGRPPVPTTIPTKLTVNFVLPQKYEMEAKQVDMVIVPATSGMMGVLPGHVSTIAQLKPGVLSIHDGADVKKYIVSSGFAFVHPNSVTDILAVEAVLAENLDIEAARKGLADYTTKLNSATTDLAKAEAQVAIEVYGSLVAALT
ncbi:hypothetical protein Mapa_002672 [Marchantia paleacea]|nr:hypothetical protein Mapa_002672 [Marchantia paleacea]